jgi:hypothetical protein
MNLKDTVQIRVDPGLFEILSWQLYIPNKYPFISTQALKNYGYNVDLNYNSIVPYELLMPNETVFDFYYRMNFITKKIVDRHEQNEGKTTDNLIYD